MKKILFIIFNLITVIVIAQTTPKVITGTVYLDSVAIQDVHIINTKLELGSISNKNGNFEILATKGDVLIISHLNIEYKEHVITIDNLKSKQINIYLDSKTYMLDEVVLKKKKGIFEVDKDILIYKGPLVNAQTLKLPYANAKKANNEKAISIKSGVSVNLTGFLNTLNGKTKQKKILKKLQTEDKNIAKIRKHFTDGFFINQLKITKENINPFLEFCITKGIINLYKKDKFLELTTVLLDNSKNASSLLNKENTRLTQK